jgi:hypothetical protein
MKQTSRSAFRIEYFKDKSIPTISGDNVQYQFVNG